MWCTRYGARPLVQIVDVLGAEIKIVAQLMLDLCQGKVGCVWLGGESVAPAHGVETPDQLRIGVPGFGGCDLVDSIAVP